MTFEPFQLIGTVGGIVGALLVAFKRPWEGHCVWLVANGCWVAYGWVYDNFYLMMLFGVYWVLALVGSVGYFRSRVENSRD